MNCFALTKLDERKFFNTEWLIYKHRWNDTKSTINANETRNQRIGPGGYQNHQQKDDRKLDNKQAGQSLPPLTEHLLKP